MSRAYNVYLPYIWYLHVLVFRKYCIDVVYLGVDGDSGRLKGFGLFQ